jgi:hypothetical protein
MYLHHYYQLVVLLQVVTTLCNAAIMSTTVAGTATSIWLTHYHLYSRVFVRSLRISGACWRRQCRGSAVAVWVAVIKQLCQQLLLALS